MIVIGLTGSIGMGKSMAATMLRAMGVGVHDADACVHELLSPNGRAYKAVCTAFPYFQHPEIYTKRVLNRRALGRLVFQDNEKRKRLENIVHPFVHKDQNNFIRTQKRLGAKIVVLDIPLLFETGSEKKVDYTLVVYAPFYVQKSRVLLRPGITPDVFEAVLKRQMPNKEKCARADYVVPTGLGRAVMMKGLRQAINDIKQREKHYA